MLNLTKQETTVGRTARTWRSHIPDGPITGVLVGLCGTKGSGLRFGNAAELHRYADDGIVILLPDPNPNVAQGQWVAHGPAEIAFLSKMIEQTQAMCATELPRAVWLGWSAGAGMCYSLWQDRPDLVGGIAVIGLSPHTGLADPPYAPARPVYIQMGTEDKTGHYRPTDDRLGLIDH